MEELNKKITAPNANDRTRAAPQEEKLRGLAQVWRSAGHANKAVGAMEIAVQERKGY